MAALRRKLDFPQSAGRGQQNVAFAVQAIEKQMRQVLAWIAANEAPSDAPATGERRCGSRRLFDVSTVLVLMIARARNTNGHARFLAYG